MPSVRSNSGADSLVPPTLSDFVFSVAVAQFTVTFYESSAEADRLRDRIVGERIEFCDPVGSRPRSCNRDALGITWDLWPLRPCRQLDRTDIVGLVAG